MNNLVIDLTHGGIKISVSLAKKGEKVYAYDLYDTLKDEDGKEYHVCLGSYTIEGKHAGYYARISEYPRIDSFASDIPVLVEK